MAIQIAGMAPLIQVFDMPTSIAFYRDVLGFTLAQTDGQPGDDVDWAMLHYNNAELMLNTRYERDSRPPAPEPSEPDTGEFLTLYFACPNVDEAYAYLIEKGFQPSEPILTQYGFKAMGLRDPDGFNLVFHWPAE